MDQNFSDAARASAGCYRVPPTISIKQSTEVRRINTVIDGLINSQREWCVLSGRSSPSAVCADTLAIVKSDARCVLLRFGRQTEEKTRLTLAAIVVLAPVKALIDSVIDRSRYDS